MLGPFSLISLFCFFFSVFSGDSCWEGGEEWLIWDERKFHFLKPLPPSPVHFTDWMLNKVFGRLLGWNLVLLDCGKLYSFRVFWVKFFGDFWVEWTLLMYGGYGLWKIIIAAFCSCSCCWYYHVAIDFIIQYQFLTHFLTLGCTLVYELISEKLKMSC